MVFILGVAFPESNLVKKSLQSFFGIGPLHATRILSKFFIHPTAKLSSLAPPTVLALTAELSSMKIENDLRREVLQNIRRLRDMGSWRGRRHAMGMPVRGQRTRTQTSTANKLNKIDRFGNNRF